MKYVTSVFLMCLLIGCRSASFRKVSVNSEMHGTISYPIFRYHDKKVERKINAGIAMVIFHDSVSSDRDLQNKLQELAEELYALDHTMTYNQNKILSFSVYTEVCGAHCESETTYLNFDLETGEPINLNELVVIGQEQAFRQLLNERIKTELEKYRDVDVLDLAKEDSLNYPWVMEALTGCMESIEEPEFYFSPNGLYFIYNCNFPHAIRNYGPPNEFTFEKQKLLPFLKSRFLSLLPSR